MMRLKHSQSSQIYTMICGLQIESTLTNMTKSELISTIASKQQHLQQKDVELAVNGIVEILSTAVANDERVEIRGFGGFTTVPQEARIGRNPKTGEQVSIVNKQKVHFKPGLDMRDRVNVSRHEYPEIKDQ